MKNILMLLALLTVSTLGTAQIVPAPTEKQDQLIEKLMAPLRKKLADVFAADKTGQYAVYVADLEALAKETDRDRQNALATELERKHIAFVRTAVKAAQIDLAGLKRQVAGILGHNKFTMDEFGAISSETLLPPGSIPLRFSTEMTCPFEIFEDQGTQSFVTNCDSHANDCSISASSLTEFDGGCRRKAWTGDNFELPAGNFSKMTVSAQFDTKGDGFVFAVGGYAKAESKIGVRLKGPGFDQLVIVKDVWVLAPLIWFKGYQFNAPNFQAQAVFSGNFAGGNLFTAQAYNETFALAVPFLDAGYATCSSKFFDFIRVVATN